LCHYYISNRDIKSNVSFGYSSPDDVALPPSAGHCNNVNTQPRYSSDGILSI
jgi:hypothetical protein